MSPFRPTTFAVLSFLLLLQVDLSAQVRTVRRSEFLDTPAGKSIARIERNVELDSLGNEAGHVQVALEGYVPRSSVRLNKDDEHRGQLRDDARLTGPDRKDLIANIWKFTDVEIKETEDDLLRIAVSGWIGYTALRNTSPVPLISPGSTSRSDFNEHGYYQAMSSATAHTLSGIALIGTGVVALTGAVLANQQAVGLNSVRSEYADDYEKIRMAFVLTGAASTIVGGILVREGITLRKNANDYLKLSLGVMPTLETDATLVATAKIQF